MRRIKCVISEFMESVVCKSKRRCFGATKTQQDTFRPHKLKNRPKSGLLLLLLQVRRTIIPPEPAGRDDLANEAELMATEAGKIGCICGLW